LFEIGLVVKVEVVGKATVVCENGASQEQPRRDEQQEGEQEEYIPKEIKEAPTFEYIAKIAHADAHNAKQGHCQYEAIENVKCNLYTVYNVFTLYKYMVTLVIPVCMLD